jgi:phospholipase/carboxylesterase
VPTAIEPEILTFKDWTFRLRRAQARPERLLILLHGWMGDENSMGVLAHNLTPSYTILSPRAPFKAPEGGYSWREIKPGTWGMASLEDLQPAAEALLAFVDEWSIMAGMNPLQFDLMGFSQGAALAYSLILLHPERVRRLAALAGFIPGGGEAWLSPQRFAGKAVFVSHGRQDDMVPVDQARRAVALLKEAGAQVSYCESDSAHKISKECLRAMEKFLGEF